MNKEFKLLSEELGNIGRGDGFAGGWVGGLENLDFVDKIFENSLLAVPAVGRAVNVVVEGHKYRR